MDSSMCQIVGGAIAVVLLGVIVVRRRGKANSKHRRTRRPVTPIMGA
jgi:hypothetical protein